MAKPDPYFIEAAARALDVIELFRDGEDICLTDVMRRLGMIKSTAFRFLYTLAIGIPQFSAASGA